MGRDIRWLGHHQIKVLFFFSKKTFSYYFDCEKTTTEKFLQWFPVIVFENIRVLLTFLQGIYILCWLWLFSCKEQILVCCENKRDAAIFKQLYGIDNVIFVSDVIIKNTLVERLNRQYKNDLYFIQTKIPSLSVDTEKPFFSVNVCNNTNIFLALGEYDSVTDFELALEAFYVLYTYKIKSPRTRKQTYLVILGDEVEFNDPQENYYKKLEGFVTKHGLQNNVFFLKIFPCLKKEIIMKVALSIIFTNPKGCYLKNLYEAIKNCKQIIVPNSNFYEKTFQKLGVSKEQQTFCNPNPEEYAREMHKYMKNKMIFRYITKHLPLNKHS